MSLLINNRLVILWCFVFLCLGKAIVYGQNFQETEISFKEKHYLCSTYDKIKGDTWTFFPGLIRFNQGKQSQIVQFLSQKENSTVFESRNNAFPLAIELSGLPQTISTERKCLEKEEGGAISLVDFLMQILPENLTKNSEVSFISKSQEQKTPYGTLVNATLLRFSIKQFTIQQSNSISDEKTIDVYSNENEKLRELIHQLEKELFLKDKKEKELNDSIEKKDIEIKKLEKREDPPTSVASLANNSSNRQTGQFIVKREGKSGYDIYTVALNNLSSEDLVFSAVQSDFFQVNNRKIIPVTTGYYLSAQSEKILLKSIDPFVKFDNRKTSDNTFDYDGSIGIKAEKSQIKLFTPIFSSLFMLILGGSGFSLGILSMWGWVWSRKHKDLVDVRRIKEQLVKHYNKKDAKAKKAVAAGYQNNLIQPLFTLIKEQLPEKNKEKKQGADSTKDANQSISLDQLDQLLKTIIRAKTDRNSQIEKFNPLVDAKAIDLFCKKFSPELKAFKLKKEQIETYSLIAHYMECLKKTCGYYFSFKNSVQYFKDKEGKLPEQMDLLKEDLEILLHLQKASDEKYYLVLKEGVKQLGKSLDKPTFHLSPSFPEEDNQLLSGIYQELKSFKKEGEFYRNLQQSLQGLSQSINSHDQWENIPKFKHWKADIEIEVEDRDQLNKIFENFKQLKQHADNYKSWRSRLSELSRVLYDWDNEKTFPESKLDQFRTDYSTKTPIKELLKLIDIPLQINQLNQWLNNKKEDQSDSLHNFERRFPGLLPQAIDNLQQFETFKNYFKYDYLTFDSFRSAFEETFEFADSCNELVAQFGWKSFDPLIPLLENLNELLHRENYKGNPGLTKLKDWINWVKKQTEMNPNLNKYMKLYDKLSILSIEVQEQAKNQSTFYLDSKRGKNLLNDYCDEILTKIGKAKRDFKKTDTPEGWTDRFIGDYRWVITRIRNIFLWYRLFQIETDDKFLCSLKKMDQIIDQMAELFGVQFDIFPLRKFNEGRDKPIEGVTSFSDNQLKHVTVLQILESLSQLARKTNTNVIVDIIQTLNNRIDAKMTPDRVEYILKTENIIELDFVDAVTSKIENNKLPSKPQATALEIERLGYIDKNKKKRFSTEVIL